MSFDYMERAPERGQTPPNPQGLLTALDLMEFAYDLITHRISKAHPEYSLEERRAAVQAWANGSVVPFVNE